VIGSRERGSQAKWRNYLKGVLVSIALLTTQLCTRLFQNYRSHCSCLSPCVTGPDWKVCSVRVINPPHTF
jgi:hypothetical protein